MIRQMITIDEEKCNGCGLCVSACQEGAIGLVNGKAVLLREDYCDGLGNCLPVCPTGAISLKNARLLPSIMRRLKRSCKPTSLYSAVPAAKSR